MTALRWLGFGVLGLVSVVASGAAYVRLAYPKVGAAPATVVERTDEKRARGAYLAEHVAMCVDCHSERDYTRYSAPVRPGSFGQGGERFGRDLGMPGELVAGNITPHALGSWSDGEIMRALTTGVTRDGRALFPLMNYPGYATLCRSDLEALVVYLRGLPSIASEPAATELDFPVNLIVRTLPKEAQTPAHCPDPQDTVAYGRYLVGIAGCADCHTPRKGGDLVPELAFSGGVPLPAPAGGIMPSANITPDEKTGIGSWSREAFIQRFAMYRDPANVAPVEPNGRSTLMPWSMFAGMTDADLGAMYDYLRTVKPIETGAAHVAAR